MARSAIIRRVTPPRRIAVIGGGPIGLEAALAARALGWPVTVYEKGEAGANVAAWGHVRLFSPFGMNRSGLGRSILAESGASLPSDDAYLTGAQHRESYLMPIARHPILRDVVRSRSEVVAIARAGLLKAYVGGDRGAFPFRLLIRDARGAERVEEADVVIDASGTFGMPNALGAGGIPCPGEAAHGAAISRGLDDVVGRDRARYEGKRILLVGGGHSAATSAIALARLTEEAPATEVTWVARSTRSPLFVVDPNDPLPERRAICEAANRIAAGGAPRVRHRGGLEVVELSDAGGGAVLVRFAGPGGADEIVVDRILANVGSGPDNSLYRELQVHECYASRGPMKLSAALIGSAAGAAGAGGDCLTQKSHGPETLKNPEPDFFIIGCKSYGRNPHFLIRVGIEQIRDVFRILSGREEFDATAAPPRGAPAGTKG